MADSCRLSLAHVLLCFLQIQNCFCNQYIKDWDSICSKEKCVSVDLSIKNKFSLSDKTSVNGFHETIYCIKAMDPLSVPGMRHLWYRYHVFLDPRTDKDVTIVMGNTSQDVEKSMQQASSIWSPISSRVVGTKFGSSPYDVLCTGVKVMADRTVKLEGNQFSLFFERRLQVFFPTALCLGLFLFFISPYLIRNIHFYYSSGVLLGVVASLLVLLYVFSKFVPKQNLFGLGVLVGGYTFTGFIIRLIYTQGLVFIQENAFFVVCYVVISSMISFAVLYRIGPAHERTLTLIKWFLQLLGLVLIFLSMQYHYFGAAAVVCLMVWNNVPNWLTNCLSSVFFCIFCCLRPFRGLFRGKIGPRRKMLTMEQYEEQGRRETERELDKLRAYIWNKSKNWRKKKIGTLREVDQMKQFLGGSDDVPSYQKKHHEKEFGSDIEVSDDDTSDHSPQHSFLSSPSSGIPSPNPTPPDSTRPSAPYPEHPRGGFPMPIHIPPPHFHTTYN